MKFAIRLHNVTKRFPLYDTRLAQALGTLGLWRHSGPEKVALDGLDLSIARGEKVGLIGRNGSGKTTLLRLIIGDSQPTAGRIEVDGAVQALMQTGIGFHDELSGLDNIHISLTYNGIADDERDAIVADIVEFVELGEFLHHPLKTYSLGMRARLEFATATAVRPDILAIDEVLGAGDGYFVRKCAARMRQVIGDGTLILVSHQLDQVREYCERVVWLDSGRIMEDGPTEAVIRSYQRFMARYDAQIRDQIRQRESLRHDGIDETEEKARLALEKARDLMRPILDPDQDVEIVSCSFGDAQATHHVLQTGDPISVRISARASRRVVAEPVLIGLSEHGAFIFEAVGSAVEFVGAAEHVLEHPRAGIGVGTYFIVPALRRTSDRRIIALGPMVLSLNVATTNWSDPPFVHLDSRWYGGSSREAIPVKISAWV